MTDWLKWFKFVSFFVCVLWRLSQRGKKCSWVAQWGTYLMESLGTYCWANQWSGNLGWGSERGWMYLLMGIINKQEKRFFCSFVFWVKLRTIAQETASWELWGTAPEKQGFGHSFIFCQKKAYQTSQGGILSRFQETWKPNRSSGTEKVGMALAPGKEVLSSKQEQHWCPQERKHFIFVFFILNFLFSFGCAVSSLLHADFL